MLSKKLIMPQNIRSQNVNNSFFDGYYKEIWRHIFPEKTTLAEIDFLINDFKLTAGHSVLDVMCGYGRHSLELARKGIKVTAVDNLSDYINEIKEKAESEKLSLEPLYADVLDMRLDQQYDAVICMGNSLQFFDEKDLIKLLSKISFHLEPRGKFLINTWSITEIATQQFRERSWGKFNDLLFLTDSKFLLSPTRIEVISIIINDKGEKEEKTSIDYLFSLNEMHSMLGKTGFCVKEIYSIPGKKHFSVGDPRAYIVAEKL